MGLDVVVAASWVPGRGWEDWPSLEGWPLVTMCRDIVGTQRPASHYRLAATAPSAPTAWDANPAAVGAGGKCSCASRCVCILRLLPLPPTSLPEPKVQAGGFQARMLPDCRAPSRPLWE